MCLTRFSKPRALFSLKILKLLGFKNETRCASYSVRNRQSY